VAVDEKEAGTVGEALVGPVRDRPRDRHDVRAARMRRDYLLAPIRRDVAVILCDRDDVAARRGQAEQPQLVRSPSWTTEPRHPLRRRRVEAARGAVGDDDLDVVRARLRHEPIQTCAHFGPWLRARDNDRQAHRGILAVRRSLRRCSPSRRVTSEALPHSVEASRGSSVD